MLTSEEIERELESFYRDYIDSFNREDVDRFQDCFAMPYGTVTGERGLTTTANERDHQKGFGSITVGLMARGWARSDIDRIKTWALTDNLGMILADVTRYKTDNSVLEKVRACYMLRRESNSWKIVTICEIKPPFLGPGDIPR